MPSTLCQNVSNSPSDFLLLSLVFMRPEFLIHNKILQVAMEGQVVMSFLSAQDLSGISVTCNITRYAFGIILFLCFGMRYIDVMRSLFC